MPESAPPLPSRRNVLAAGAALAFAASPARADDPRRRLVAAYPDFLARAQDDAIVWRDGSRLPWSDGRPNKSFEDRLAHASLADQMSLAYPSGPPAAPPGVDDDPGRFRNLAFFQKMYGASEAEVRANLAEVAWRIGDYRGALPFTRVNGVDRKAAQIVEELAALPERFVPFLVPPAGSFEWRDVAGTERLSPHAFGIAVDINAACADYWRWERTHARHSRVPYEIVEIFERHGFIWGGKWYHYDTMHFEYRPELFGPA